MARFVFLGDSITDAGRNKDLDLHDSSYGYGYVRSLVAKLFLDDFNNVVYNRGISGHRSVDLYARIKSDVWNLSPDILTILVGVNDVWHEIECDNGVDIKRYENVYRAMISETLERVPNVKIILIEPFFIKGPATEEHFDKFLVVKDYAKVVDKLAKEFNLPIVKIQDKLEMLSKENGELYCSGDGVHLNVVGSEILAEEWYKVYLNFINSNN